MAQAYLALSQAFNANLQPHTYTSIHPSIMLPPLASFLPASFSYLYFYLFFSTLLYLWETYLDMRLIKRLKEAMKHAKDNSTDRKALDYSMDKINFSMLSGLFSHIVMNIVLYHHGLYLLWSFSSSLLECTWMPDFGNVEICQSLIFITVAMMMNVVLQLPFSLYRTFHIEAKYGFNQTTLALYFMDMLKGLILFLVIGWPFITLFLYVILWTGASFVFFIWIFMMFVQLLAVTIYPTLIQPLFNKVTELDTTGALYQAIKKLADRVTFPLKRVYVIDGSKRSNHSNAYFYGFFKNKRIVLFDTLIQQCTEDEVVAILGHELGHWQFNHTLKTFFASQLHLFVFFYLFSHWIGHEQLYTDFGFPLFSHTGLFSHAMKPMSTCQVSAGYPILIGFMLFQFLYSPIESILAFLMNVQSRRFEFQADAYAAKDLKLGKNLISGLEKLQEKNLGNNYPDWLHSAYHHSHPPVAERINVIKKMESKMQ